MRYLLVCVIVLSSCGSPARDEGSTSEAKAPSPVTPNPAGSTANTGLDSVLPRSSDLTSGEADPAPEAPSVSPYSATGLRIGDTGDSGPGIDFISKEGELIPELLPAYIPVGSPDGEVIVGFLKMDSTWETASVEEQMKRLNPWSNIYDDDGVTRIGCVTPKGAVMFEGKEIPCE